MIIYCASIAHVSYILLKKTKKKKKKKLGATSSKKKIPAVETAMYICHILAYIRSRHGIILCLQFMS